MRVLSLRVWRCNERQEVAVVLQQDNGLRGNLVGCLALFRRVEFDVTLGIKVRLAVEEAATELVAQDVLDGTFKSLGLDQSLVDGILQILVIGTCREVNIATTIDSSSSLLNGSGLFTFNFSFFTCQRQLVDGRIVADHHTVET